MPKIDVNAFFDAAASAGSTNAELRVEHGKVQANPQQGAHAPTVAQRKASLPHLNTFWAALKNSPLYGKSVDVVKQLFTDAKNNHASIPLSSRFVQNVKQQIDAHIRQEVLAKLQNSEQIPASRMAEFTQALSRGDLDLGQQKANIATRATISFLHNKFFNPNELKRCRPIEGDAAAAARRIGLFDMEKNLPLRKVFYSAVMTGKDYGSIVEAVISKLFSQIDTLEHLEPDTLRVLSSLRNSSGVFAAALDVQEKYTIPVKESDPLMRACLWKMSETAPTKKPKVRETLVLFQVMKSETVSAEQRATDSSTMLERLVSRNPDVQKAACEYLEKSFGALPPRGRYTEDQVSEARRVAVGIFSQANMDVLQSASSAGLLHTEMPKVFSTKMVDTLASMNTVLNGLLDKKTPIDQQFIDKMFKLGLNLGNSIFRNEASNIRGVPFEKVHQEILHACLDSKNIAPHEMTSILNDAVDKLQALSCEFKFIVSQLHNGELISKDNEAPATLTIASSVVEDLCRDCRALLDQNAGRAAQSVPVQGQAPATHILDQKALGLISITELNVESQIKDLSPEAQRELEACVPACANRYSSPSAELKLLVAELAKARPELSSVPLDNLNTVPLRRALANELTAAQQIVSGGHLSSAESKKYIRQGIEKYLASMADFVRKLDNMPDGPPPIDNQRLKELSAIVGDKVAFAKLPPARGTELMKEYRKLESAIFTANKQLIGPKYKAIIKEVLPTCALRDLDAMIVAAKAARESMFDMMDFQCALHTTQNLARASGDLVRPFMSTLAQAKFDSPEKIAEFTDIVTEIMLRSIEPAKKSFSETRRLLTTDAAVALYQQIAFLRDAVGGVPPAKGISFSKEEYNALLQVGNLLASMYRVVNRPVDSEQPVVPDRMVLKDDVHSKWEVDGHVRKVLSRLDPVHYMLKSTNLSLSRQQYEAIEDLVARCHSEDGNDGLIAAMFVGDILDVLAVLKLPEQQQAGALWKIVSGLPEVPPNLTLENFGDAVIQRVVEKLLTLNGKSATEVDDNALEGAQRVAMSLIGRGVSIKHLLHLDSKMFFTMESLKGATDMLTLNYLSAPQRGMFGLQGDLQRLAAGSSITWPNGEKIVVTRAFRTDPSLEESAIERIVTQARNLETTPEQGNMLIHLLSQVGLVPRAILREAYLESRDEHGCINYRSEKTPEGDILLHISSASADPVQYSSIWTISPDGTAKITQLSCGKNKWEGTSLARLPDVNYGPAVSNSEAAKAADKSLLAAKTMRSLTSIEDIESAPILSQGTNTCFITSILNSLLSTEVGREALKQRVVNGNIMLDVTDNLGAFVEKKEYPLNVDVNQQTAAQEREAAETFDQLWKFVAGDKKQEDQLKANLNRIRSSSAEFSALEQALMDQYQNKDLVWRPGQMGVVQEAGLALGLKPLEADNTMTMQREFKSYEQSQSSSQAAGVPGAAAAENASAELEDSKKAREENWKMLERARTALNSPGAVPIVYTGQTMKEGTIGHYMAVVGIYGEGNRVEGRFGLIVRDSLTKTDRSFPLDSLICPPPNITTGPHGDKLTSTSRIMLITLVPRDQQDRA